MSCSGQQRGAEVAIGIDFETTFGVDPGSPAMIQVPYVNESLNATRAQNMDDTIDGRRDEKRPTQGNTDISGSITVPVDVRYFPYWLKALFGAPSTSGAGPYTHVFKIDNADCQPSLVLQKNFSDIPRFFKYNGIKVNSMGFQVAGDGNLQATIGLVGASVSDSASDYDASPTTHSYQRYKFLDSTLKEGGSLSGEFMEIGFDINSNLQTDIYPIGGGGNRTAIPEGKMNIKGKGKILFDNLTLYNKAKNATESSVEVICTNGAHSLSFDFNEVEYGFTSPMVSGNEGVFLDLDFVAYFDNHADDSAIVVTVINDVASYA